MNNNSNSQERSNNSQRNDWQSFSFLCDSTGSEKSQSEELNLSDSNIFPLSQAEVGDFVCIVEILAKIA
ncbi:MAG: hypothetical protein HC908_08755 [Calothrix sp. SM1_7_51]|nr:hypothetical protein [Calothrix sp. SM1_7_51]